MTSEAAALELRAARRSDAAAIAALMNLPGVRRGTLRLPFTPEEEVERRIAPAEDRHTLVGVLAGRPVAWATLLRGTGRTARVGELALAVHDDHAGRGIGRRVLAALLDLAGNGLGLVRLEPGVDVDNAAAIRLYESAGFAREGTQRAVALRDGAYVDGHMMARLRPAPTPAPAQPPAPAPESAGAAPPAA